jgi:hypothetical protein
MDGSPMHQPLHRGAPRLARGLDAALHLFFLFATASCTADHADLFASMQPGTLPRDGGSSSGAGGSAGDAHPGEMQADSAGPSVQPDAWHDDGAGGGASDAPAALADARPDSRPEIEIDSGFDPGSSDAPLVDASIDLGSPAIDAAPVDAGQDASFDCDGVHGIELEGHCYFAIEANGWAADACDARGAHLASIASEDEQRAVQKIDPGQDRWIGLRRPPNSPQSLASFVWSTGEPLSYSNWASYGGNNREPNYTGQCVRLLPANTWADNDCTDRFPIVCEHE